MKLKGAALISLIQQGNLHQTHNMQVFSHINTFSFLSELSKKV